MADDQKREKIEIKTIQDPVRELISHLNSLQAHACSRQASYEQSRIRIIPNMLSISIAIGGILVKIDGYSVNTITFVFSILSTMTIFLNVFFQKRIRMYHDVISRIQIQKRNVFKSNEYYFANLYTVEEIFFETRRRGRLINSKLFSLSGYSRPDAITFFLIVIYILCAIGIAYFDANK